MTKTIFTKLKRFAEQTVNGTIVYNKDGDEKGLNDVGNIADLMEWADKNRYNQEMFKEGIRLIQIVSKYRSLERGR